MNIQRLLKKITKPHDQQVVLSWDAVAKHLLEKNQKCPGISKTAIAKSIIKY